MDVLVCSASGNSFIDFLHFVAEFDGRDALHCNRTRFDYAVHNDCVPVYKEHMAASNYTNECPWPHIQPYVYCVCI